MRSVSGSVGACLPANISRPAQLRIAGKRLHARALRSVLLMLHLQARVRSLWRPLQPDMPVVSCIKRSCGTQSSLYGRPSWRRLGVVMKRTSAAFVVGFAAASAITDARALSGTELYKACRQRDLSAGGISCIAYVRGFVDGMTLGHVMGKTAPTLYCPPRDGIAADQGRIIVKKYLRDHPESLHLEAGNLAANALTEAFSCPPKTN